MVCLNLRLYLVTDPPPVRITTEASEYSVLLPHSVMDAYEVLLEIRRDYGLDIQISDARARTAVANLTRTVERACHKYVH